MVIKNSDKDMAYQLKPGATIEMERTSLFFNDYGEQSLPFNLPDTPQNRQALGFPDKLANYVKPAASYNCTVSDGAFFANARQVILSAKRGDGFDTALYLNEGSFLNKLKDTRLYDVFAGEKVDGVTTVNEAVAFCQGLINNDGENDRFACFEVFVDDGNDEHDLIDWVHPDHRRARTSLEILNEIGNPTLGGNKYLVGQYGTTRQRDGKTYNIPPGSYITPFLKTNYVLRRMFEHFGYTLNENFFDKTAPFTNMVLLNNTCDTLLNGQILLTDLLPNIKCSELLDVFRRKFFCEFVPRDGGKEVDVVFFKDRVASSSLKDYTKNLVGGITINYPERYKELRVRSEDAAEAEGVKYDSSSVIAMSKDHPSAYIGSYKEGGCLVTPHFECPPTGFTPEESGTMPMRAKVLAGPNAEYDAQTGNDTLEVTVPDRMPSFMSGRLVIGKSRWLNSVIQQEDDGNENAPSENNSLSNESMFNADSTLRPMLAFAHKESKLTYGYLTDKRAASALNKEAINNSYSLLYNGRNGIVNKFYKRYDDILRNSGYEVEATLLLNSADLVGFKAHAPVLIDGCTCMPNVLTYNIGNGKQTANGKFVLANVRTEKNKIDTVSVDVVPEDSTRDYEWVGKYRWQEITEAQYNTLALPTHRPVLSPKEKPVAALMNKGYYNTSVKLSLKIPNAARYIKLDCWLEVQKVVRS